MENTKGSKLPFFPLRDFSVLVSSHSSLLAAVRLYQGRILNPTISQLLANSPEESVQQEWTEQL